MSNERSIIACAVIASALGWPLPATAEEAATAIRPDPQHLGLTGRTLSDEEMSDMRGGYLPGNTVTITVDGVEYTDYDPNTPGSASVTVPLGPGTVSRGTASTAGTGGSSRVTITLTNVTVSTAAQSNLSTMASSLRTRGVRR